jgi:hypothetical protein
VQHSATSSGDWREEIVTFVRGELRIYSTTVPATDRRVSLMQDPLYRNDVTHRSMGYPHVPMTSYYLGARPDRRALEACEDPKSRRRMCCCLERVRFARRSSDGGQPRSRR